MHILRTKYHARFSNYNFKILIQLYKFFLQASFLSDRV